MQHIERPHTLIEEDPQLRKASTLVRVEKMFEQIQAKLPGPPEFILCVLPERKNSEIYGMLHSLAPLPVEDSSCLNHTINLCCFKLSRSLEEEKPK